MSQDKRSPDTTIHAGRFYEATCDLVHSMRNSLATFSIIATLMENERLDHDLSRQLGESMHRQIIALSKELGAFELHSASLNNLELLLSSKHFDNEV